MNGIRHQRGDVNLLHADGTQMRKILLHNLHGFHGAVFDFLEIVGEV